jgi:hypothetical protein
MLSPTASELAVGQGFPPGWMGAQQEQLPPQASPWFTDTLDLAPDQSGGGNGTGLSFSQAGSPGFPGRSSTG